ncbi:MAG TPA: hypothetical protein VGM18_13990 [Candidatus Sulfotelmatobacter sp.]
MTFQVKVADQKDRIVRIAEEIKNPSSHEIVVFRDQPEQLPVVRLPIDLLLYRMENGRTGKAQEEYIRRNKLDENYFVSGEEDEEAQMVQHALLLEIAKDPRADIYAELKYKAVQSQNLLITHSGVVVNGNRRLVSMRELLDAENTEFSKFGFVNVTVLPSNATFPDLEEIESELQEIPETKLEYDWISRKLKLRRRRDHHKIPPDKLRKMYRFKSQKDINREIEQLELAEDYLERYLKRPREYEAVDKSEQMFKQLQQALENKSGEIEELSRLIAYPLVKEARGLQDRAYQFRFAFGEDAEELLRRLAEEEKISIAPTPSAMPSTSDDDDPLGGVTEETTQQYSALKPIILDAQKSKERAQQIARITAQIQQEKQEGGRKMLALRNAESANSLLHDIELNGADPSTFPKIRAQLVSCSERAQEIISKIPIAKAAE